MTASQASDNTQSDHFSNKVSMEKNDTEYAEELEQAKTHATYIEREEISQLSEEHRNYLLSRHGTLDLDPVPDFGDADPYNWPHWKKVMNLTLVALHACMSTFTSASIQSAFIAIAADLDVSLQRATYLTSLQIAILGGAPFLWRPLANRYGRRPIFLISLVCSALGNIGCAKSPSYASMAACRAIVAFFISPAAAIGSAVVAESFFRKDRARYMGVWTLMITLGVPVSPFIFGFVAYRVNYRWIYWILAIINGVQFVLYALFGPETRYIRKGVEHHGSSFKQEYMTFTRIDPTPLTVSEFFQPLIFMKRACVIVPAAAYSMIFIFASVMITVEIPQLFGEKFHFNTQQLGLQFLGTIIGSVIGEQIGGAMSDFWMNRRSRKISAQPPPEFRLWLSYIGYLLSLVGVVVFLIQIQNAPDLHWNVSPIIGAGIAGAGNQIVTTVLITYAVDCYREEAGSVGVFITFIRQMWGFIGPFWFPAMFTNTGLAGSAGIASALMIGVSILPTVLLQWKGKSLR